jgi:hypothetical protein
MKDCTHCGKNEVYHADTAVDHAFRREEHMADFGNCKCGTKAVALMGRPNTPEGLIPYCAPCLETAGGPRQPREEKKA